MALLTEVTDESTVPVTLEDGSTVQYTMRGLTDDEIQSWAQFCASVFAYKANPPPASYFERHFYNDPARDASLVRVMVSDGDFVSSCRIFQRNISLEEACFAGGIGEVCTSPQHRKRGLSKLLLQNAIEIMTNRGMRLSLLHADPAFFSVYQKGGGYENVKSTWSVVNVIRSNLQDDAASPYSIRQAQFPKDTSRIQAIHQTYSEQRFVGCIIRSEEYWNEYICKELEGSLWTLVQEGSDEVIAWLSLRQRGERYQLRDFGCDTNVVAVSEALSLLLKTALCDLSDEEVPLHLPTVVLDDARPSQPSYLDFSTAVSEDDDGWMYKTLKSNQESMVQAAKTREHLIWPADSF